MIDWSNECDLTFTAQMPDIPQIPGFNELTDNGLELSVAKCRKPWIDYFSPMSENNGRFEQEPLLNFVAHRIDLKLTDGKSSEINKIQCILRFVPNTRFIVSFLMAMKI